MMCPRCEVWELGGSENFCSWCGLALLRFEISTDRSTLSSSQYPPPVVLTVANVSSREIDVESVTSSADWITLLQFKSLPHRIGAGQQGMLLLDVDTIAAVKSSQAANSQTGNSQTGNSQTGNSQTGNSQIGKVQVHVAYAGAQAIILEVV